MQAYHLLTERPLSGQRQAGKPEQSSTILAWARRSPGAETGGMVWYSTLLDKKLEELDWTMADGWGRRRTQPVSLANNHVPMSRQLWISLFIC